MTVWVLEQRSPSAPGRPLRPKDYPRRNGLRYKPQLRKEDTVKALVSEMLRLRLGSSTGSACFESDDS